MNGHLERIKDLPEPERVEKLKQLVRFARRAQMAANKNYANSTTYKSHFKEKAQHFAQEEYEFRRELEKLGIFYTEELK